MRHRLTRTDLEDACRFVAGEIPLTALSDAAVAYVALAQSGDVTEVAREVGVWPFRRTVVTDVRVP